MHVHRQAMSFRLSYGDRKINNTRTGNIIRQGQVSVLNWNSHVQKIKDCHHTVSSDL